MTEQEFIKENAGSWRELESEIKMFSKAHKRKKLDKKRIDNFITLYNRVANHLAYSRTYFGECSTSEYLNKLMGTAHSLIYSKADSRMFQFFKFITVGFPELFRKHMKVFLISFGIFMISFLFAFILTAVNIENSFLFVPSETVNQLRNEGQYDEFTVDKATYDTALIGTNNIQVSFLCFALGITLGIGTIYVLITNGLLIGALAGIVLHKGQSLFFWSLILPHGVTELFAIFVSGASGLIIGYSLINPKKISRKDSLIVNGIDAVKLVLGCIPILIISAIIESYFTPLALDYIYKYLFSFIMLVLLIIYLCIRSKSSKVQMNLSR